MTQKQQAHKFHALHKAGTPLVLYNVWDAATAKAAEMAGSPAVATGSLSLGAAQGYDDGQNIPFDLVITLVERMAHSVQVPLSVDFECGYASAPETILENFKALIRAGVVGINFEDQNLGESGLVAIEDQALRIKALRGAADENDLPIFINARTDIFLQAQDVEQHADFIDAAIIRAKAYHRAGASGFFVPGLKDLTLIQELCSAVDLPVNVMASSINEDIARLANAGVARVSYGPLPFFALMQDFQNSATKAVTPV